MGTMMELFLLDLTEPITCFGEEEKRTFLKQTLIALGSIMLLQNRFVFAEVAGITVLPIHTVFSQFTNSTITNQVTAWGAL